MLVEEIWRYPVKSLQGERLDACEIGHHGLVGDRGWAIFDLETGLGLTARRVPELLFASARLGERGDDVAITGPDGSTLDTDEELSNWLGRAVELRSADSVAAPQYENVVDTEDESRGWSTFDGSTGAFHDATAAQLTLVSRTTLGDWPVRRFRPNLVVDGAGEDDLVGAPARVGEATVLFRFPVARCVMVTRPQPDGIEADRDVLRTIARERDNLLSVGATVERGGTVRVGDEVKALAA